MNFLKKPIICLALAIMVLPMSGFAQYQFTVPPFFSNFSDLKRYELGFTFIQPTAHFEGVVPVGATPGGGDTTAKRPLPGVGFGISIGLSLPFKATGHISCWAVDLHLLAHMYTWSNLNMYYTTDGSYEAYPTIPALSATTIQVALPIGVQYKIGNDAIETKRLGLGTSFGVGVMPSYNMTSLTGNDSIKSHSTFGFNPYVSAELSVFAGICMKLRLSYAMGDITLLNVNKAINPALDGPFKITSNSTIMATLVFMPFSGGWYERKWYSTHDTYNQHDRLN